MSPVDEFIDSFVTEMRRGTLLLTVLSQLKSPQYGYSLVQKLAGRDAGVEAGTLYPLLRRLEKQGLLKSEWDTTDSRPRKYYVLSEGGSQVYARLLQEWQSLVDRMDSLLREVD